jgi:hypothetical protein
MCSLHGKLATCVPYGPGPTLLLLSSQGPGCADQLTYQVHRQTFWGTTAFKTAFWQSLALLDHLINCVQHVAGRCAHAPQILLTAPTVAKITVQITGRAHKVTVHTTQSPAP